MLLRTSASLPRRPCPDPPSRRRAAYRPTQPFDDEPQMVEDLTNGRAADGNGSSIGIRDALHGLDAPHVAQQRVNLGRRAGKDATQRGRVLFGIAGTRSASSRIVLSTCLARSPSVGMPSSLRSASARGAMGSGSPTSAATPALRAFQGRSASEAGESNITSTIGLRRTLAVHPKSTSAGRLPSDAGDVPQPIVRPYFSGRTPRARQPHARHHAHGTRWR